MSWFTLLKNDRMKEQINNIKELIADFNSEVLDMEDKLEIMLEEIYTQVENLEDRDATEEAKQLTRTDIGRFFLDADFNELIELMEVAYEESMEDEDEEDVEPARMPNEKVEEILNNAEDLLPEIEKEGGKFLARQVEEMVSIARKKPERARSLARALAMQIKTVNEIKGTNLKVD